MSKFMDSAVKKLNDAQRFLQGKTRDYKGYLETRNRILTTAQNYEMMNAYGYEPMTSVMKSFSEGPGMNSVANTTGIDVVDISILTSVKSFLPYLAVDRGMSKPTDLLTYQVLEAINDAGGMNKGDIVVNPFKPITRNLNLSRSQAGSTKELVAGSYTVDQPISFDGLPIAKGKIEIIYKSTTNVHGYDLKGDGKIYWDGPVPFADGVTVDYTTGIVTFKVAAGSTLTTAYGTDVSIQVDTTSEYEGSKTLKMRPKTENLTITAEPNRVILETSMEQIAYMNRLLGNQLGGNQKEFGQVALQQLLNAFIYWINSDLVTTTYKAATDAVPTVTPWDMSAYYGGNFLQFSNTKDDRMNAYMLELQADLLTKSNKGPTYILVGAMGANLLANNATKFVKSDIFAQELNGLVGTYDGMPVLRHDLITAQDANMTGGGFANIILGHKDMSGAAAPIIYGLTFFEKVA